MDPVGLLGVAGLLLVKEAGLPVPVPGDLVVLSAGVAAANGDLDPAIALPVIVGATIAGGLVQFGLIRGPGRAAVLGLLGRLGVPRDRIDRVAMRLQRRGAVGVATARMTPGLRVVAIAAAGLAGLRLVELAEGLVVGNGVFVGGHFILGFAVGKPAIAVVAGAGGAIAAVVALAIVGAGGWWLIVRRRRRRQRATGVAFDLGASSGGSSWADAACPACLALALVAGDRG